MSDDNLALRIVGVDSDEAIAGARTLRLRTTRGTIPMVLHAAASASRAVVCICGAIGGFDGPTMLYPQLGRQLPPKGISVVASTIARPTISTNACSIRLPHWPFWRAPGTRAAIVGHSFGGAVAINAGTISPVATAVVAISSQLAGAHVVGDLTPKPLLLIHGTADNILPARSSELIYERAREPKSLKLFEGGDHRLSGMGEELFALVDEWLPPRI